MGLQIADDRTRIVQLVAGADQQYIVTDLLKVLDILSFPLAPRGFRDCVGIGASTDNGGHAKSEPLFL
jgi:hypothetical protein